MARTVDEAAKESRPGLNMTPMIDVTFQLIIVFLCSMKFRTLDMKMEAALAPQGAAATWAPLEILPRLHVLLKRAPGDAATRVLVQDSPLGSTAEGEAVWTALEGRVREFLARDARLLGELDAAPDVPHGDVVRCLDAFQGAGLADVRFRGTAPPR